MYERWGRVAEASTNSATFVLKVDDVCAEEPILEFNALLPSLKFEQVLIPSISGTPKRTGLLYKGRVKWPENTQKRVGYAHKPILLFVDNLIHPKIYSRPSKPTTSFNSIITMLCSGGSITNPFRNPKLLSNQQSKQQPHTHIYLSEFNSSMPSFPRTRNNTSNGN